MHKTIRVAFVTDFGTAPQYYLSKILKNSGENRGIERNTGFR